MATVIFVFADADDDVAGAELVGLLGLLDELVLLLTEQPAIASAATAASGRACSRHRLAADVISDISSPLALFILFRVIFGCAE